MPTFTSVMSDLARTPTRTPTGALPDVAVRDVEVKPSAEGQTQELFLSPRVLDRRAFDVFADSMRELIERAADETAKLALAAGKADAAQQTLAQEGARLEARHAAALASAQLVHAQAEDAKRLIHGVEESALRLRTLEMATARGVEEARKRLDELTRTAEARLAQLVDAATERLDELERRASEAHARAEAMASVGAVGLLGSLCARAETLTASTPEAMGPGLADLVARAERTRAWTKDAMSDLDQLREQCMHVRQMVGDTILQLCDAADRSADRSTAISSTPPRS